MVLTIGIWYLGPINYGARLLAMSNGYLWSAVLIIDNFIGRAPELELI
jgi:hypothetical protein